jgi:ABC-type dipeptide/oligopeptide/nickel transport system ATPase component
VPNVEIDVWELESQFRTCVGVITSLRGIDLRINEGGTLGLVGGSRRGKSVPVHSVMRLLPVSGDIVAGEVTVPQAGRCLIN